jgi:hypothetical protein
MLDLRKVRNRDANGLKKVETVVGEMWSARDATIGS